MKITLVFVVISFYFQVLETFSIPFRPETQLVNKSSSVAGRNVNGPSVPYVGSHLNIPVAASSTSRIYGGSDAAVDEFPWQVALYRISPTSNDYICGGSVIDKHWILTTASCIDRLNSNTLGMVQGKVDLCGEDPTGLVPTNIYVYPLWTSGGNEYDIALIQTDTELTSQVVLATLDEPDHGGDTGTIVGWGSIASGTNCKENEERLLKKSSVPIMSNDKCIVTHEFISSSHICITTVDGHGFCHGDEGGPLVVDNNGTPVQVGIMSFFDPLGCNLGLPQVLTRVSSFVTWIKAVTGLKFP